MVAVCILIGLALRLVFPKTAEPVQLRSDTVETLSSFYTNPADYETAFAEATASTSAQVPAYAAITSHHFLAKRLIARTMTGIDPTNVKTVIVISPDHFSALTDSAAFGVTTLARWETPFGELTTNPGQLEALATLEQIELSPSLFFTEHGVYTLVPFIKKQFPDANFVPMVLRSGDDYQQYAQLGRDLRQFFDPEETLLIISSDFSHLKTPDQAQRDDQQSIRALESHTLIDVPLIDSDCKVCMATLFGYLENLPTQFQLVENTDSFAISGQEPESVTSYVSGYFVADRSQTTFSPPLPLPLPTPLTTQSTSQKISLLFTGDVMLDRTIRQKMNQYGNEHVLRELVPLFRQYNFVIINLEGPITSNPSRSVGSTPGSPANFIFTFDPSVAKTLFDAGVSLVNLGNNHIRNFGEDGVQQTKQYLSEANIRFFGDTGSESESKDRVLLLEREGVRIGLTNYNQFTTDGLEHALADIAFVRPNVDLLIIYTHWGNEYVPAANAVIESQAHRFIDAGADLVVGSHPHVIQNTEEYRGKRIYYSLGNFIFDQYFSPETQQGLLVGVEVDPQTKEMRFTEYKVRLQPNGQTVLEN